MQEIDVVKELVSLVSKLLADEVAALYLRGSLARGDWVLGLSDADFYLIIRDYVLQDEHLQSKFKENLHTLIEEVKRLMPTIEISCEYESESEVRHSRVGSFIIAQDSQFLFWEKHFTRDSSTHFERAQRVRQRNGHNSL